MPAVGARAGVQSAQLNGKQKEVTPRAWRPNLRDESDNHLVELAVAGGAEAIVTRNVRDFRVGADLRFPQIRIVTPVQFLRGER